MLSRHWRARAGKASLLTYVLSVLGVIPAARFEVPEEPAQ
jgi:hypothetical protein